MSSAIKCKRKSIFMVALLSITFLTVSACSAPIRDTEAKLNTTAFALPFEMKSGREEYKWLSEGISITFNDRFRRRGILAGSTETARICVTGEYWVRDDRIIVTAVAGKRIRTFGTYQWEWNSNADETLMPFLFSLVSEVEKDMENKGYISRR